MKIATTCALLAAFVPPAAAAGVEPARPSRVVLVTIDTLRRDAVSHLGGPERLTPTLDRLAARGATFTDAWAPSSWTVPSMASLLTGLAPSGHGVVSGVIESRRQMAPVGQQRLSGRLTTLAEAFREAGWLTVGVPANRHLHGRTGFEQGFDHYWGPAEFTTADVLNRRVAQMLLEAHGPSWQEAWLRRPTFLWVHYFDPHDPYLERLPWAERFAPGDGGREALGRLTMKAIKERFPAPFDEVAGRLRALYLSEVGWSDARLGDLLDELGSDDDTLVVVTSDHGEEFAEHGGLGHGQSLHDELVRIPMVVSWPRGLPGGARIDGRVCLTDLLPTLAELCGLEVPRHARGTSLIPALQGLRRLPDREQVLELFPPFPELRAVVDGRWKLIVPVEGPPMLFDRTADPGELADVAARNPERVRALLEQLKRWRRQQPRAPKAEVVPADDDTLRALRALGYVR